MQFLLSIWQVFFSDILTQPSLLLGIVVALGYILLKRPWIQVFSGALKTAVGVLILQLGAGQLVGTFRPILEALTARFGVSGTILDPYAALPAALASLGDNAAWVGYTILIALATNIVLVLLGKVTKLRGVFLTGHIMFIQSALVTAVVAYTFKLGLLPTVLIAGIVEGIYWAVGSHILIKPTEVVTNNSGFTIGHQQMFYDWFTSKVAHFFGDPKENDAENLELPGWMSIMQDNIVAMGVVMTIFMFALMLAIGIPTVQEMAGTQGWFTYTLLKGLSFAVYVTVILTGVRLFVAELATSFKGVSDRLLKGAVVAVDCPAIFPFSPNAWIIGFLTTAVGQLVGIGVLLLTNSPVLVISGFVPWFFDGGPVGVYANKFGGVKAVFVMCFILGLVQAFGSALIIPFTGMVGGWMGNADWATVWPAIIGIMRLIGNALGLPVPPAAY